MKKLILLSFAAMFLGFYEFTGGNDFEPLAESPFVEGREVDMAPLKPVVVATKPKPADLPIVQASLEAPTTLGDEADLVEAAKVQLRTVVESSEKAESLTEPADEIVPEAIIATETVTAEIAAKAETPEVEVARLSVDPTSPVLPAAIADEEKDIRSVTGSRVNMRMGPGTNFDVLTKLVRGDEVVVLRVNDDGWARLRGPNGRVGWMAARLLTPKTE